MIALYSRTCDILRQQRSGQVTTGPVVILSDLPCTAPDPANIALKGMEITGTLPDIVDPQWLYIQGIHDIVNGDEVQTGGKTYKVRYVQPFETEAMVGMQDYMRLIIEATL